MLILLSKQILRQLIDQYRADHPRQTGFAHLHFSNMVAELDAFDAGQKKASGLFKAVKEATQQVEEARLLAERSLYLAQRMPLLLGGLSDFWTAELTKNQDIQTVLQDIHLLSSSVHQLPNAMYQTLNTTLNNGMQQISAEREAAIEQFFSEFVQTQQTMLAEEKAYSRLLAELRDTLQESNQLVESSNDLANILFPQESSGAGPAMGIDDYRAILTDVNETLRELNRLVAATQQMEALPAIEKVNQLIVSSLDQVEQGGETLIDLSFKRGLLLILIAATVFLIAQTLFIFIKRKLVDHGEP